MQPIDLELEILKALQIGELRPSKLQEKLYPKFKHAQTYRPLSEETFRTTLNRKLKKLYRAQKIKRIDKGHQNVHYELRIAGKKELLASEISSNSSTLDDTRIDILRNMLIRMKTENENPENFCFAFIGTIPLAFSKTEDAFRSHLFFEDSLRQRHRREIEKIKEEVERAHPNIPIAALSDEFTKRVEKEVGWRLGEYFKRLNQKIDKEKNNMRKIMLLYGITDKMLEEMYRKEESVES